MSLTRKILTAAAPIALLGLGACATPFSANVSRFQQLPAPQGQTFRVVSDDPRLAGGLEFSQYASLVADRLEQVGYVEAPVGTPADLRVTLDYDVDNGREKIRIECHDNIRLIEGVQRIHVAAECGTCPFCHVIDVQRLILMPARIRQISQQPVQLPGERG